MQILRAYRSAIRCWRPLPPGNLVDLLTRELRDQRYLLQRRERYGPIFKAMQDRSMIICVVGLVEARGLLAHHERELRPASVPLRAPFPKGLLRVMEGEDHRRYRQVLATAIQHESEQPDYSAFDAIIEDELRRYASSHPNQPGTHTELTRMLERMTAAILLHMYFGVRFGSPRYEELVRLYFELGPDGYEMRFGPREVEAFEAIRRFLKAGMAGATPDPGRSRRECVLDRVVGAGELDEVALGNLIYMVEIGRADLRSLFRWLLKYAADQPEIMAQIAGATPELQQRLGSAFVLETLRLSQIERLIRWVKETFVFNGYCFPKGTWVRLCLWESHKSAENFPEPFAFDLGRFVDRDRSVDEYAPFGLGQHRCPMADLNVALGARFMAALAKGYVIAPVGNEPPHRGRHHWEPARQFTVHLAQASDLRESLEPSTGWSP
jgi:cytochrome P450